MRVEERHLFLHRGSNRDLVLDIFLGSVLNTDEAQTELNLLVHDSTFGVSASVHDVNLRNNTDSSDTLRVDFTRHTKTLLSGHISVSGDATKDNCP